MRVTKANTEKNRARIPQERALRPFSPANHAVKMIQPIHQIKMGAIKFSMSTSYGNAASAFLTIISNSFAPVVS